jgi:hypothetical protein
VPDPAPSSPGSPATHEATVASLAQQTQTPTHVAGRLCDQEMAALQSNARVKNFISDARTIDDSRTSDSRMQTTAVVAAFGKSKCVS